MSIPNQCHCSYLLLLKTQILLSLNNHELSFISAFCRMVTINSREPSWGTSPMAKVMRKEAWHMQWWNRASGVPLEILEHLSPKPESACFTVMLSTYSSDINRGLSPHHLFLEKVNLELLDDKSPGHNKSVSIQKPLWWLSSLPAGLLQLCMWLFAASRPREAQEA